MVQKLKIGHSYATIRPKCLIGKKSRTDKHTNTPFKLYKELHKPYFSYEQLFAFLLADGTAPPPPPPPPEMSEHHVHFNPEPQVYYYYYTDEDDDDEENDHEDD